MSGTKIAHAASPRGELVLRRRVDDGALELRVNGIFVMDTVETATERALATLAVEGMSRGAGRRSGEAAGVAVLVGGLGLGFTLRELVSFPFIDEIVVAEIEGTLIDWHRAGLVPATTRLLGDTRVVLVEADIRKIVESRPVASLDAIILDVDNGPGFLVYDDNAAVYRPPFLHRCSRALTDSGCLVVWSAAEDDELESTLRQVFGDVRHQATAVRLGSRPDEYHTYVAHKDVARNATADPRPCPVR